MKFYDKHGNEHDSFIGSLVGSVSGSIDNFLRNHLPGYDELMDEDEHLYDDIDHIDVEESQEEDFDFDEGNEQNDDEPEFGCGDPSLKEAYESYLKTLEELEEKEMNPPTVPEYTKIEIDYAAGKLYLKDDEGNRVGESDLDERLRKSIIDKRLIDAIYGNQKYHYTCKCGMVKCAEKKNDRCSICGTAIDNPVIGEL